MPADALRSHAAAGHIVHRRCSLSLALLVVLFIATLFLSRCLVLHYSGAVTPEHRSGVSAPE